MMTFTEAAVHVLRLVGKPLHYKEITDVAIEKDLLSHVGKSPEVTMGARLAAVVKKGGRENLLSRVKPGVFALAEWSQNTIDQGLSDRTPALERMALAEQAEAARAAEVATEEPEVEVPTSAPPKAEEEEPQALDEDEKARAQLSAAATALFEPEDDDDEPILGGGAEEAEEDDDEARRRGGRRRRRRGRDREDDGLPSYTVSDASFDAPAEAEDVVERTDRGPSDRRDGRDRDARDRGDRERNRDGRERGEREPGRERGEREREPGRERGEREREPGRERGDREREGRDREDAERRGDDGLEGIALVENCLSGFRRSGAVALKQLTDAVSRRPGGKGADASWVSAIVRADNLRRQANGERPRFRLLGGGRVALVEWGLDRDALAIEKVIQNEAERLRQLVKKQLLRKLNELPHKSAAELWMVLLERLGYREFKVVRRPGTHPSELHWSALHSGAAGDVPVAIVVRRDGRDLGRERVADLRGSLHHYGAAAFGVLVTTGQVMTGAREEASAPFATPVVFLDGTKAAELCEQYGVGLVRHAVVLPSLDTEWFESLRSGQ